MFWSEWLVFICFFNDISVLLTCSHLQHFNSCPIFFKYFPLVCLPSIWSKLGSLSLSPSSSVSYLISSSTSFILSDIFIFRAVNCLISSLSFFTNSSRSSNSARTDRNSLKLIFKVCIYSFNILTSSCRVFISLVWELILLLWL